MRILVFVSATLNAAVERGTKPDAVGRQPGHRTSTEKPPWCTRAVPSRLPGRIGEIIQSFAFDMRILCVAPQVETPAVWLGTSVGGCT